MKASFQNTAQVIEQLAPEKSLYCLSTAALALQVNRFLTGFPGTVAFAVKANPTPQLIQTLVTLGVTTYDVASIGEIQLLRSIMPDAHLLYDNPVKSRREIEQAYNDYSVRSFAFDDQIELEKIRSVVGSDSDVELTARFKIASNSAVYDLSSKFGADQQQTIELLKMADQAGYLCALTFHPGSQCTDPAAYREYIKSAADIVKQWGGPITSLNIGGGFPSRYLGQVMPAIDEYFTVIAQAFEQYFGDTGITLICEPGRALVDSSVSLLCQVKHRRADATVFINDGIYGGFMEQLFSPIVHPLRVFRGNQQLNGQTAEFTVWGPTCDSIDLFAHKPQLPLDIRDGDWIEFGLMGGYGSSTSTHFNGFSSESYVIVAEGFPYPDRQLD